MLQSKDSFNSLDVSEYLKFPHKELIRKINTLISKGILTEREMRLIKPITGGGRRQLAYDFSVDEFVFIIIRFSSKPIQELGLLKFLEGEIVKATLAIDNYGGFDLSIVNGGGAVGNVGEVSEDIESQMQDLGMSDADWEALG